MEQCRRHAATTSAWAAALHHVTSLRTIPFKILRGQRDGAGGLMGLLLRFNETEAQFYTSTRRPRQARLTSIACSPSGVKPCKSANSEKNPE